MDSNLKELADSIYREKVLRARAMPASRKMGLGAEMFAEACGRMRSGIRAQFPDASETDVEEILRHRLDRLTRVEEFGIFTPAPLSKS
jgi:hypothetical protein